MTTDNGEFPIGKLIRLVAGISIIILLVQYAMDGGPAELLRQLSKVSWQGWFILCGTSVLGLLVLSSLFQLGIRIIGVRLPYIAAFDFSAMNSFFNTILPMKGGLWIRGAYLKRRYDVSWTNYLFVMASGHAIQLVLLVMIAAAFVKAGQLPLNLPALPDQSVLLIGTILVVAAAGLTIARRGKLVPLLNRVIHGLKLWIRDPRILIRYLAETIVFHGLTCLRLWLAFSLMGTNLTIIEVCVLYAVLAAGMSWTVTPGNLGVKEAAIVMLATIIGIDTQTAIAASIVDRIASLIVTFLVGGWSAYRVSSSTASR